MAAPMIKTCCYHRCRFLWKLCLLERCMISSTHAIVIQSHVRAYSNPCALKYSEYGDPSKVVQKTEITLPYIVDENSVLVKMIAAPVNPADINTIQGVYPIKPSLPAVGGFEGVGVVQEIGKQVTKLLPGDVVIPGVNGIGTWCSHTVQNENDWLKIPPGTPTIFAATLRVNNCTAYRMLKDFARLEAGDVVIQNAANSGCGQAAIQIAAARGIQTINIVRQRSDFDDVCQHLKDLGATEVISDFSAQKGEIKQLLKDHGKPRLALNAVGGKAAITLMKYLEHGGTMVTYGGMSRQPITLPTGLLIFNDIKVVGYWMSRWHDKNGKSDEAQTMISELCDWSKKGKLKLPRHRMVPLMDYKSAIEITIRPYSTEKQILSMESL